MDYIKKALHFGFGAWAVTREKVEETVAEMIKRGEITSQESKKWVDDMLAKIEAGKKEMEKKMEEIAEATLKRLCIPTRSEMDALKKKVDELSELLAKKEDNNN